MMHAKYCSNQTNSLDQQHSYCLSLVCSLFDFIRRRLDYFCRLNDILEGRAGYVVSMGRVSVIISYSFGCLTTETEKYTNENLAASKYSI